VSHKHKKITILQTGRLGDLWFTTPLAWHLHQQGVEVEVAYNAKFGNPFTFFPYIKPRPLPLRNWFPGDRFGYGINEMIWQPVEWLRLKRSGRTVIWNQIFPYRLLQSMRKGKPLSEGDTMLVFTESQSIRFKKDSAYYEWIGRNLRNVIDATGLRPVVVAYGDQPDHPVYETWRGSLEEYQHLIAGCGAVFGISTSAHVLGQLLGKPLVTLYEQGQHPLGMIGNETVTLSQGEDVQSIPADILKRSSK